MYLTLGIRLHEDVQPEIEVVNSQAAKGHFERRSGACHRWDADADDLLVFDRPLLPASQAREQPVASGATATGTASKDRDTDRQHAALPPFFRRQDDLDIEPFETLGLGNAEAREVS